MEIIHFLLSLKINDINTDSKSRYSSFWQVSYTIKKGSWRSLPPQKVQHTSGWNACRILCYSKCLCFDYFRMFPVHCSIKVISFASWKGRLLVRVTGIRLENWLTVYWGLGTRSGQAQVYSLMAITGNKKLTPVIHCLHLHLGKAEINQLQTSIKTCRQNLEKKLAQIWGVRCIR